MIIASARAFSNRTEALTGTVTILGGFLTRMVAVPSATTAHVAILHLEHGLLSQRAGTNESRAIEAQES
jgi:hypothetical protein